MVLRHVVNSTEFHCYLYTVHGFNAQETGHVLSYVSASYLHTTPVKWATFFFDQIQYSNGRSQWPRGLRRRSAAAHLLRSWVRIPPGAWMSVCCECCVLSGRGLCDELITRPEESYRLWCVVVCDLET